jgi:hypothetical protein
MSTKRRRRHYPRPGAVSRYQVSDETWRQIALSDGRIVEVEADDPNTDEAIRQVLEDSTSPRHRR